MSGSQSDSLDGRRQQGSYLGSYHRIRWADTPHYSQVLTLYRAGTSVSSVRQEDQGATLATTVLLTPTAGAPTAPLSSRDTTPGTGGTPAWPAWRGCPPLQHQEQTLPGINQKYCIFKEELFPDLVCQFNGSSITINYPSFA